MSIHQQRREQLKQLKQDLNLSIPQIAGTCLVSEHTARSWLYGTRSIPAGYLKLLKLDYGYKDL